MDTVYVVFGTTGEYSDNQQWPVRAFADAAEAESFRDRLNAYAANVPKACGYDVWREYAARNPDDPAMQIDYTGTEYGIDTVPFGPAVVLAGQNG